MRFSDPAIGIIVAAIVAAFVIFHVMTAAEGNAAHAPDRDAIETAD